jgi:GxxExxY protein
MRQEPPPEVDALARSVLNAAFEVHKQLGPGFLESVYESAMKVELSIRGIPFLPQYVFNVPYKNETVGEGRVDLLVGQSLVVELKAIETFAPIHTAQVISYLKALKLPLGLLINFNVPLLKAGIKRIILTEHVAPVLT